MQRRSRDRGNRPRHTQALAHSMVSQAKQPSATRSWRQVLSTPPSGAVFFIKSRNSFRRDGRLKVPSEVVQQLQHSRHLSLVDQIDLQVWMTTLIGLARESVLAGEDEQPQEDRLQWSPRVLVRKMLLAIPKDAEGPRPETRRGDAASHSSTISSAVTPTWPNHLDPQRPPRPRAPYEIAGRP